MDERRTSVYIQSVTFVAQPPRRPRATTNASSFRKYAVPKPKVFKKTKQRNFRHSLTDVKPHSPVGLADTAMSSKLPIKTRAPAAPPSVSLTPCYHARRQSFHTPRTQFSNQRSPVSMGEYLDFPRRNSYFTPGANTTHTSACTIKERITLTSSAIPGPPPALWKSPNQSQYKLTERTRVGRKCTDCNNASLTMASNLAIPRPTLIVPTLQPVETNSLRLHGRSSAPIVE